MSIKADKEQLKQLKMSLRAANRKNDYRLLRLALVMLILVLIAAYLYGKIQL